MKPFGRELLVGLASPQVAGQTTLSLRCNEAGDVVAPSWTAARLQILNGQGLATAVLGPR
jgi:hypothetical protein